MVQWLRLSTSKAEDTGSIPVQETKIPYASKATPKTKKKACRETFKSPVLKGEIIQL